MLAVALAIVLSIGAVYLTAIFLGPIELAKVKAHQESPDRRGTLVAGGPLVSPFE